MAETKVLTAEVLSEFSPLADVNAVLKEVGLIYLGTEIFGVEP